MNPNKPTKLAFVELVSNETITASESVQIVLYPHQWHSDVSEAYIEVRCRDSDEIQAFTWRSILNFRYTKDQSHD